LPDYFLKLHESRLYRKFGFNQKDNSTKFRRQTMNLSHQPTKTAVVRFLYREGKRRFPGKRREAGQTLALPYKTSLSQRPAFLKAPRAVPGAYRQDSRLIQLPKFSDHRGSLSFIEGGSHIPFKIQAVYWIHDVSDMAGRADKLYRGRHEFVVALSGSVEVVIENGREKRSYRLNRPDQGLHVPNMVWRRLERVSADAVILVLASPPHRNQAFQPEPLSPVEALQ
jgi:hypothetical protein